ncbi:lycopene cyclase domain-containing protein [Demequina salsinemoris]|uniref:lycopene cyclase domain-containing protein n=1 Tax=Demequina salsinemoris TaxID=577470 RepID=UPI000A00F7CD|nr:lycopene cyclase domain-containing protein [Demequina salsinemoris]
MGFIYLATLIVSLAGLVALDRRLGLALFVQPLRTAVTVGASVAFLLCWDAVGVARGIFFVGDGPYQTGVLIAPEIPLEEVLFLTLLAYQTLLLWRWFSRRHEDGARGAVDREVTA